MNSPRSVRSCVVRAWRLAAAVIGSSVGAHAHVTGDAGHDAVMARFTREFGARAFAALAPAETRPATSPTLQTFGKFSPHVKVRSDGNFLWVESNGLPAHGMMTGITAWQQQVPLPQPYTGMNAWRIPLHPRPAAQPASIKNRFLRGAIALAANGIPIFNPQNNRGEVSSDIGELDQWGGHCGRADDYHYHVAPLHLQEVLGRELPVAYALDGYAIYGLTEPDGSEPSGLDAFHGHETRTLGYHYHASKQYPFVNGGFHGEVVEKEEQVDPQPRAQGVRPALTALRGARITGFEGQPGQGTSRLSYTVNGRPASVAYTAVGAGVWRFQFASADGQTREETYRAGERGGGGGGGKGPRDGKKGGGPPRKEADARPLRGDATPSPDFVPRRTGLWRLQSPAIGPDGRLPVEFTGDGDGISPPLEWTEAPAGTRSFAVIMHHLDPQGQLKWYWTLYNLPPDARGVPKNVRGVGTLGNNSVNRQIGYAPPHSKGPGAKTYVVTVYALSAPLQLQRPPAEVSRAVLLAAMEPLVLDTAELKLTYTRPEETSPARKRAPTGS